MLVKLHLLRAWHRLSVQVDLLYMVNPGDRGWGMPVCVMVGIGLQLSLCDIIPCWKPSASDYSLTVRPRCKSLEPWCESCCITAFGILKSQKPFDPNFLSTTPWLVNTVSTIDRSRDTALPSSLSHSSAAGIDITNSPRSIQILSQESSICLRKNNRRGWPNTQQVQFQSTCCKR